MWFIIGLAAGYALGAFTWPPVRLWLMKMKEHPIDTIERDIAALREKLRKLRGPTPPVEAKKN